MIYSKLLGLLVEEEVLATVAAEDVQASKDDKEPESEYLVASHSA